MDKTTGTPILYEHIGVVLLLVLAVAILWGAFNYWFVGPMVEGQVNSTITCTNGEIIVTGDITQKEIADECTSLAGWNKAFPNASVHTQP